jgi:biotin synthase-related radical SAM superfamily protein
VIHVALGTAHSLGLVEGEPLVSPTTAHFMNGGQCVYDCAYCTRARTSTARGDFLCRVPWPAFDETEVSLALEKNEGKFTRVCLQIVNSKDCIKVASNHVKEVKNVTSLPLSVELRTKRMDDIDQMFNAGADYVGLPLDVASAGLYPDLRGGTLEDDLTFLLQSAHTFKGRIGTHLIAGLGESEAEMVITMKKILEEGLLLGLFAFTPCRGTRMESTQPPSIDQYRRIQLAKHLISTNRDERISFDKRGRISSFGLEDGELGDITSRIYETQGCEGCNRPYYNERPGGRPYNYPRELTEEEFQKELKETLI